MAQHIIYPCLWFDNNAQEAAEYYCGLFSQAKILSSTPMVTSFEINGARMIGLNGGPEFKVNPAISFFVYCGSDAEITRLYNEISREGGVLMPLDKYDWSAKYAWVSDKFGVNWQLDIDPINSSQGVVPNLLFANHKMAWAKKAIDRYCEIFPESKILMEVPFSSDDEIPAGALMFAQIKLSGFIMNAMSSTIPHDFDFTPATSFVVECDNQAEIDYYWEKLGAGGHYDRCGWLQDEFGVSWQVVPNVLPRLMSDPEKGMRVVQAMMQMQKFDIATLENA